MEPPIFATNASGSNVVIHLRSLSTAMRGATLTVTTSPAAMKSTVPNVISPTTSAAVTREAMPRDKTIQKRSVFTTTPRHSRLAPTRTS